MLNFRGKFCFSLFFTALRSETLWSSHTRGKFVACVNFKPNKHSQLLRRLNWERRVSLQMGGRALLRISVDKLSWHKFLPVKVCRSSPLPWKQLVKVLCKTNKNCQPRKQENGKSNSHYILQDLVAPSGKKGYCNHITNLSCID